MRSTNRGARKKDRVLSDECDRSGFDVVSRSLNLIQWLRDIKYDVLSLRARIDYEI
jgi:hypothetical protein